MIYDLIIIGGGPAGAAAGVYAARKKIRSLLITKDWGGQSKVSPDVQNWIGIKNISGLELAKQIEEHVKAYAENVLDFDEGSLVVKVSQIKDAPDKDSLLFEIETDKGKKYQTRTIIIASGASRKKLNIPGADKFESRGVVYCASCDAPLFKDKQVAVIGSGNAGLETAQQLLTYCSKIYVLEFQDEFIGDSITREALFKNEKVLPIASAEIIEIKGDNLVSSLVYKNRKTGEEKEIEVQGVFVEIGSLPNTDFIKDFVKTNKYGEITIEHKTGKTSIEGIWAAGDATDQPYKQNNISMGDAVKALEDLYIWLQKKKSKNI